MTATTPLQYFAITSGANAGNSVTASPGQVATAQSLTRVQFTASAIQLRPSDWYAPASLIYGGTSGLAYLAAFTPGQVVTLFNFIAQALIAAGVATAD